MPYIQCTNLMDKFNWTINNSMDQKIHNKTLMMSSCKKQKTTQNLEKTFVTSQSSQKNIKPKVSKPKTWDYFLTGRRLPWRSTKRIWNSGKMKGGMLPSSLTVAHRCARRWNSPGFFVDRKGSQPFLRTGKNILDCGNPRLRVPRFCCLLLLLFAVVVCCLLLLFAVVVVVVAVAVFC